MAERRLVGAAGIPWCERRGRCPGPDTGAYRATRGSRAQIGAAGHPGVGSWVWLSSSGQTGWLTLARTASVPSGPPGAAGFYSDSGSRAAPAAASALPRRSSLTAERAPEHRLNLAGAGFQVVPRAPTSPGPSGGSGGGGSSAGRWVPPKALTWYWQLQGTVNNSEPVAAYDIDGFDNSAAEVSTLHGQGKHVICYIDVGTAENWRPDYSSFPASVLGSSNGWPGERWLDISKLSILEPIMTARFQMCREKGFDAVEPDNMDGYENSTGFPLSASEQLTYDEWIAGEVRALGMAVLQKNDGEQTAQLEPYFDGALDEQCNQYHECSNFQPYLAAGKPVLNAEYSLSTSSFCAADNAAGIMERATASNSTVRASNPAGRRAAPGR